MNERIKQLAELAKIEIEFDNYGEIRVCEAHGSSLEKFAELIIRECIYIAYEYDKPKLSGPGLQIASDIESHFEIYIDEDGDGNEDCICPTCGVENPTTSCGLPNCGLINCDLITGSQE